MHSDAAELRFRVPAFQPSNRGRRYDLRSALRRYTCREGEREDRYGGRTLVSEIHGSVGGEQGTLGLHRLR